jgi:hypothetical protein
MDNDHYTIHGEETVLYCIVNRPKFEPAPSTARGRVGRLRMLG